MAKHTSGPWEVDLETGEITASGPVVLGTIYGANDFPCNENDITEECNANAQLIAAAPELLEILEQIIDCPYSVDKATVPHAGIDANREQVVLEYSIALLRIDKARAIIAKAKGEPCPK